MRGDQIVRPTSGSFYELLGGRKTLDRVHKRFYDRLYSHPVFGVFFADVKQEYQESQQSDFMMAEFGGPQDYRGRLVHGAHQHMFITEKLFDLRHEILKETLDQCAIPPDLRDRWLQIDERFRGKLVNQTVDQCEKRYGSDQIIVPP